MAAVSGCVISLSHQPNIWVYGIDSYSQDQFIYNIDNSRVLMTGTLNEFKTRMSKNELFDGLRRSYRVFSESDDRIQLICNRQIYTVRRYADGHYALYGEMLFFEGGDGLYDRFPFPTDKMPGGNQDPPQRRVTGTQFTTTADMPYLLRFYEVYGDVVKVEGNKITYAGCTITVEPGGLVKVAAPPPTTTTTLPWLSDAEVSKEATDQLWEKMDAELGTSVILDTLDLRVTSVNGEVRDLVGVATAHMSELGMTITYDVRARFVQGTGLVEWGYTARKG